MKISFAKLKSPSSFEIQSGDVIFRGEITKTSSHLVDCKAKMTGKMPHFCDRCGKEITLNLDESLNLSFCDGVFKDSEDLSDVIEFFDGEIDLDAVLQSEIEAYKSDYFYCDECKFKD